jgi:hypothetical protein
VHFSCLSLYSITFNMCRYIALLTMISSQINNIEKYQKNISFCNCQIENTALTGFISDFFLKLLM